MKRILSIILLLPILTFSQITVKSQETNEEKVVAKTDFSQNFTQYTNASQFLGLIGQKLFALPLNPKYDTRYLSFSELQYITKEKVKTNIHKYNVGDKVPVENADFYNKNIANKYFIVKQVKFSKGFFNGTELTPEEWQNEMKKSTAVRGVDIYLTDEKNTIDLVTKIDGVFTPDEFLSVGYFENLKNLYLNKTFLYSDYNRYEIPSAEKLKYRTSFSPYEIKPEDIYKTKEVLLEQSNSENSRYPDLFVVLTNTTNQKDLKIAVNNKYTSDKLKYLSDYQSYTEFYNKSIEEKNKKLEERKQNVYKFYGKVVGDKILAGQVELGMDRLAVIYALGYPDVINETKTVYGTSEQFVYRYSTLGDRYYYFENGKLTAIQK